MLPDFRLVSERSCFFTENHLLIPRKFTSFAADYPYSLRYYHTQATEINRPFT